MSDNGDGAKGEVFIAGETDTGARLDTFIASRMPPHVSRSRVKEIIKTRGVQVNARVCAEPNYRLKANDLVKMEVPEPEDATPLPQDIPLDIFHEDENLLVVNKPAGMVVHPAVGNPDGTLVNALLHHCGDSLAGIGGVRRPGIVHRLDKDTSGLIVIAKTEVAHSGLSAQFADHGRTGSLERNYLALAWNRFERKTGSIDAPLGRSGNNRMKRAVVRIENKDAKQAITHYTVKSEHGKTGTGEALASLVECRLETGRTHQIRVHMAHIGHPLVGDMDYGRHFQTKENTLPDACRDIVQSFRRQALHAAVLGFDHPATGEHLRFEARLPEDMSRLIKSFDF